jgi:hypothetical protein
VCYEAYPRFSRRTLDTVGWVSSQHDGWTQFSLGTGCEIQTLIVYPFRWDAARIPQTWLNGVIIRDSSRLITSQRASDGPRPRSTQHGGVLSTHLALLHRPAGSSGIYSYLSKEEGESTRNVLSHSGLIAPSPPGRKHTKSTLDVFRLRHRSKAYETYSHFTVSASVPAFELARMTPEAVCSTSTQQLVPLSIRLRPLDRFPNACGL